MNRRIQSLSPYAFQSDFSSPAGNGPERISLSAEELAGLLADARQSAAELVREDSLRVEAERLAEISDQLRQALSAIVDLAAHLERANLDEHDRQTALKNIRQLASRLIDGQGELFPKGAARSSPGNHSAGR